MTSNAVAPSWTAADMTARPDFLVIGAMKAATSTICAYLEDHPDVFMVQGEPNFFSHEARWARGPQDYAAYFAKRGDERICGEGSNDYTYAARFPHSAERIAACLPDVRLVFMVRDPVARMASAWIQRRKNGRDAVPPTLDEAVTRTPTLFVDQSLYWAQLQRYRAHFSDDQIFVGFMEDMKVDQPAFMARLCMFLGVPSAPEVKRAHANPSKGKSVASPTYSRLRANPAIYLASRLVPKAARDWIVTRGLSQRVDENPRLSPEIRSRLLESVRPDAEALLAHCGKPADFWSLGG
jgi:hypothetical protein